MTNVSGTRWCCRYFALFMAVYLKLRRRRHKGMEISNAEGELIGGPGHKTEINFTDVKFNIRFHYIIKWQPF